MIIAAGSTSVSINVYFVDDDGGTAPGEPTTGLLFSDIETGGSASYQRQGAARVDFTLITRTVAEAYSAGGFILIDDTNMPGLYRLDIPDAALASGVDYVMIQLVAASGNNSIMRPIQIDIAGWLDTSDRVDVGSWLGGAIPAQGVTGVPEVDVTHHTAGLAPSPATTGVPDVNTVEFLDTAVVLSNGLPDINVEDWLGTIVTATTAGRPNVNISALDDSTNAAAVLSDMLKDGVVGTADSGTSTTIVDSARTEANDRWNGSMIVITSGASAGQARIITDFVASSDTITFAPAVTTNLNTETYVIIPQAGVDLQSWLGTESTMVAPSALTSSGEVDVNVTELGGVVQSLTDLKDFADDGYNPATNKVTGVLLVDTTTTNTDLVTAAVTAAAVWDLDATSHQTGGTFGQAIGDPGANAETMYDAVVTDAAGTNVSADVIVVKTTVDAIETDTGNIQSRIPTALVNSRMDSTIDATGFEAAAVDLIWDETMAGHSTSDTSGLVMNEWQNGGRLDLILDAVETNTQDIQSRIPSALVSGAMDSDVSGWNGTSVATPTVAGVPEVDITHIEGATTLSELTGVPSATPTLSEALMILYMSLRNSLSTTETLKSVTNDAGTVVMKATLSDDGTTFVKAEFINGP